MKPLQQTFETPDLRREMSVKGLLVMGFSSESLSRTELGKLNPGSSCKYGVLSQLKDQSGADEVFMLNLPDQLVIIFSSPLKSAETCRDLFLESMNISYLNPVYKSAAEFYSGMKAVETVFELALSFEPTFISQIEKQLDTFRIYGLSGSLISLLLKRSLESAQKISSETNLNKYPVSTVDLAFRSFLDQHISSEAKVLVAGEGPALESYCRMLAKHNYQNIVLFNKAPENLRALALELDCNMFSMDALSEWNKGCDVLIVCTDSHEPAIAKKLFRNLIDGVAQPETLVDLANPPHIAKGVEKMYPVKLITAETLHETAILNKRLNAEELPRAARLISEYVKEFRREVARVLAPKDMEEELTDTLFGQPLSIVDFPRQAFNALLNYIEHKYKLLHEKTLRGIPVVSTVENRPQNLKNRRFDAQ